MAPKKRPVAERFWEKVTKTETCWLWSAWIERNGYGRFWLDGRQQGAHRVAYELVVGPIPDGLQIDHLCRVRNCVNPEHLEPVTCAENTRRAESAQSAKTHCPQGHPYDEENTVIRKSGHRLCRECEREAGRRDYQRHRQAYIDRAAKWRAENLERAREITRRSQAAYRQRNKDKEQVA